MFNCVQVVGMCSWVVMIESMVKTTKLQYGVKYWKQI